MTYFEKLKDPRWQKKRLRIMERDGFTCRDCDATDKTLHVHHCFYEKGDPWKTDDKFLLTVCNDCHEKRQRLELRGKMAVAVLFSKQQGGEDTALEGFVVSLEKFASHQNPVPHIVDHNWICDVVGTLWGLGGKLPLRHDDSEDIKEILP